MSSTYTFDNTYTRAADTTAVFPASNIGPSLAALMLGIPTQVSIGQNAPLSMRNPYYGGFFQDTWRVTQNLTLNLGLRYEFEDGITESEDRWITEFDPDAQLAITQLAQAAYARSPIPQVPVSQFSVLGGSVYAGAQSRSGKTWEGESMWMPRVSAAYKLGERTVVKAGYGLFFDTLNAADYPNGNSTSSATRRRRPTWPAPTSARPGSWGSEERRPADGRSVPGARNGTRFEPALADSLGANAILGSGFNRENPEPQARAREPLENRRAARAVRATWRSRSRTAGMYADRVDARFSSATSRSSTTAPS